MISLHIQGAFSCTSRPRSVRFGLEVTATQNFDWVSPSYINPGDVLEVNTEEKNEKGELPVKIVRRASGKVIEGAPEFNTEPEWLERHTTFTAVG